MKQKSPIKQRILEYIEYKEMSKYEFYKTTGITRGILDQQNGINESNIIKFINSFSEIQIPWLITGDGDMIKSNTPKTLEKQQDNSDQEVRNNNISTIIAKTFMPLIPIDNLDSFLINHKAEQDANNQSNFLETAFSDADFYTRIHDPSLYPLFNSGDVIACKLIHINDFIQWNKIYLLSTNQGTIVKRILQGRDENHLKMCSDNPKFHAFEISRDEIKAMAIVRGGIHLE